MGAASRIKTGLAVLGVIAIPVTYGLVTGWNPAKDWRTWLGKIHLSPPALSSPAPPWTVTLADQPRAAVVSGGVAVFIQDSAVEGRSQSTGAQAWTKPADWGAIAGPDSDPVVLVGRKGHGYQAVYPQTGAVRWTDPDGLGAWTYRDLIVSVGCAQAFSCTLTARSPGDGSIRWHTTLDGNGRKFAGANKAQAAVRTLAPVHGPGLASQPGPAPELLAFTIDNEIEVYSAGSGHKLHTYRVTGETRYSVDRDVVLASTAKYHNGSCRFSITAYDPDGNHQIWHKDGYDARTSSGLGCEQRRDPVGAAGLISVATPDGHDALMDASTGGLAYEAPDGASLLDTDGRLALLRSPDRKSVRVVQVSDGSTQWSRPAGRGVEVGLAPGGLAVFSDADNGKLTLLAADSGRTVLDVKSGADILGYGSEVLVINIGRTVGLLGYAAP